MNEQQTYTIYAMRQSSQFNQTKQQMKCNILEVHRDYMLVDSLNRHEPKYPDASVVQEGLYAGKAVRRINRDQALVIVNDKNGKWITWETLRRKFPSQNRT